MYTYDTREQPLAGRQSLGVGLHSVTTVRRRHRRGRRRPAAVFDRRTTSVISLHMIPMRYDLRMYSVLASAFGTDGSNLQE